VLAVTDPFNKNVTGMVSDDGQAALIRLQFEGTVTNVPAATKTAFRTWPRVSAALPAGSTVVVGGDLFSTSLPSLSVTEIIGVLVALFVLIVTFRSLAVAWFPLVSAIIGVILSVVLIFASTAFATVSSTTPMLAIMLGLAVGIDYALFIVARHQDQVRAGIDPEESAARATGTAGSAVMFAGVTVLIALVGLGFAGIPFLTTMGLAAAGAVAVAVAVAVTLTPALLGFAKGRVAGWPRVSGAASRSGAASPRGAHAGMPRTAPHRWRRQRRRRRTRGWRS
jgi:RND superfamily putative drug exporter